jgi:hypothetical protein
MEVDEAHRAAECSDAVGETVLESLTPLAGVLDQRRVDQALAEDVVGMHMFRVREAVHAAAASRSSS